MEVTETVNYCPLKTKDAVEHYEKNDLIPFVVEEAISQLIKDEGFIQFEVSKKPFSTSGGNYMGDLFEVDIKGKTKEGDKNINVFIKKRITGESLIDILDINSMYIQELLAYTQLGKLYNILQDEAGIPEVEKFKMAKCYTQSNDDVLIFENLSRKGYDVLYRMDILSIEFAELSLQQLAKFHGLSIVLENQKPEEFKIIKNLFKNLFVVSDDWMSFCKSLIDSYLDMFNEDIQSKVLNFFYGMKDKFSKYTMGDTSSMKCYCHGDYRINNILKREEEGKILEIIPIDYQFVFTRSPVLDIIYFIYPASDRKFRKEHMRNLLDIYYNTMKQFLEYFEMDVTTIYPKENFFKDFYNSVDYGLMISLFLLPLCFVDDETVPDFSNYNKNSMTLNDKFKDRISEIFDEFIDMGIL